MATRSSLYSRTGPWFVDAAYAFINPFALIECFAFSKFDIDGNCLTITGLSLL